MSASRKRYKFNPGDVLLVVWQDAHTVDAWTELGKPLNDDTQPAMCRSVGFFIKITKHALVISASVGLNKPDEGTVGGTWVLPKGMIKSIELLRADKCA